MEKNKSVVVKDSLSGSEYVVMQMVDGSKTTGTVFDADHFDKAQERVWYRGTNGYAMDHLGTLHGLINPAGPGMTVDHISRVKLDNRSANLRIVGMDEQNSNRTETNNAFPPELLALTDLRVVPKGIFYDRQLSRFSFHNHPYIGLAAAAGVKVLYQGTRSAAYSDTVKAIDVLAKYVAMCDQYAAAYPADYAAGEELAERRRQLAEEFVAIAAAAHRHSPGDFPPPEPVDATALLSEAGKSRLMLRQLMAAQSMTDEDVACLGGPKNLAADEVYVQELDAVMRIKGQGAVLYDASMADQMKHLNWESDDLRVHVSPKTRELFPSVGPACGRIKLPDFVFQHIAGRAIPPDMMVASVNMQRTDVRMENLTLLPDTGRGQKPPKDTRFDAGIVGDLGMEYMPKGVTISKDRKVHNFTVKLADQTRRFSFASPEQAARVFNEGVLPHIRSLVPDFDSLNAVYQRLCQEYALAVAKAT